MKLIYDVEDRPPIGRTIVFAIQQLLAIMAATLVVPVIIGHDMSPAAALLGAGIGSLIYILFTKAKSPVFLGSSFAFIGSMTAAFAGGVSMSLGYLGLIIGAAFAGLVYVIIAIAVKLCGVKWISKIMPAVVIGPVVAIIGLSLAGNAVGDFTKVNYTAPVEATEYTTVNEYTEVADKAAAEAEGKQVFTVDGKDVIISNVTVNDKEGNPVENVTVAADENGVNQFTKTPGSMFVAVICGLITLAATMLASCYGKKMTRLIPFVIGILAGYAAASLFFIIGNVCDIESFKIINYSALTNLFGDGVTLKSIVSVPDFTFVTAMKGLKDDGNTGSYIASIAVAYIPVAFVVFAEHIADHKNLSSVIGRDLLEKPGLHRTLLGDGVGSMVGAFFGGCPNTTYGESVGCVAITKNASAITIIFAAIGAIIISFLSPFVAFVNTIPSCVMGGVCIALYGFIAVSGLKMIKDVNLDENKNLFVVSVILIAGIGGLTLTFGKVTLTSIACALILGVLANLMLKKAPEEAE